MGLKIPKITASKDPSTIGDISNYKIVNEYKMLERMDYYKPYNSKILFKGKMIFESNDFIYIKQHDDKLLFIGNYPAKDKTCQAQEDNNAALIDKNGKKLILEGIDRFGYISRNDDNHDYFDVHVYTGQCTPVKNEKYAKGDFHTKVYTFEYKSLKLIGTKASWQHADCDCK